MLGYAILLAAVSHMWLATAISDYMKDCDQMSVRRGYVRIHFPVISVMISASLSIGFWVMLFTT